MRMGTAHIRKRGGGAGARGSNKDGTNLFIDRVSLSEHEVTTEQPRKKGIMWSCLFTVYLPLEEKKRLVNCDEFGEIRSMLFRCAQDDFDPLEPTL